MERRTFQGFQVPLFSHLSILDIAVVHPQIWYYLDCLDWQMGLKKTCETPRFKHELPEGKPTTIT
jgi:hypothetical protein